MVHSRDRISVWTFPLNVGFVGAYAKKRFPKELKISLYKRPENMIEAIRHNRPDVIGLSYYVWNEQLNRRVFEIVKELDGNILTVGGGPYFTNINVTKEDAIKFFDQQQCWDAFVIN